MSDDAPERIWISGDGTWDAPYTDDADATAYVRADLHDALMAENARLREALGWYGEQSRLCRLIHAGGDEGRHALSRDGGEIARAALGAGKPTP